MKMKLILGSLLFALSSTTMANVLSAQTYKNSPTPGRSIPFLKITSEEDNVVIHNITVNRGNCKVLRPNNFPHKLQFASSIDYQLNTDCRKVIEAVVDTNYGKITLRWKS